MSNPQLVHKALNRSITQMIAEEKEIRKLTIIVAQGSFGSPKAIMDELDIHTNLTKGIGALWNDKTNVYVKPIDKTDRALMMENLKNAPSGGSLGQIWHNIVRDNDGNPEKIMREPARIELLNVPVDITLKNIMQTFELMNQEKTL